MADFLVASLYFNIKDHDEQYMPFFSMFTSLKPYFDLLEDEFIKTDPVALRK
jgi:hypothetical protein